MSLLKAMVFKLWTVKHTDHKAAQAESAEFKDVNIPAGEAYKQASNIILRIKDLNAFLGIGAGKVTTGDRNNFMGWRAGYNNTTGKCNNFIGYVVGYANTTGNYNNFMGHGAGQYNTIANYNNFMGYEAGFYNTLGNSNNFMGFGAGHSNTTGNNNNYMGYAAGYNNTAGHGNVSIGSNAGYYETGSNKLFIDNQSRTNEADGRIKALIYGVFDAATANQLLRINGILELTEIKSGSTQGNAGAGANEVWKTNGHASLPDNVLMIGV